MTMDVFISYCRSTAREQAIALSEALAADKITVFLDQEDIPPGSSFPVRLADGLLNARTVVVFADETYFQRTWCVYEFRVALASYRAGTDPALEHVVVALAPVTAAEAITSHFPPPLAQGSWPQSQETAKLAALVKERLAGVKATIGQRLEGIDDDAVRSLRHGGLIPAPSAPPARLVAPASMPVSLQERFIGRTKHLWKIFSELETRGSGQASRSCLLQGAGGMGKSQLAAEYVMRYGSGHYPGGIIWIDASGNNDDLSGQFRQVLEQFGRTVAADAPLERLTAELSATLRPLAAAKRLLWVVDNIPEPAPGKPPERIARWCPLKAYLSLLCTSRRGVSDMDATLLLSQLPVSAAIDLLSQPPVVRNWLTDKEWQEIVNWIGCWPLGLQILHTDLGDGFVTAQSLLAKARSEEPAQALDSAMEALRSEVEQGYLRGVAEIFRGSYTTLQSQPEALLLAHALALLARAPVPEQLLEGLASGPAVGILSRRSLIQATETGGGRRGWAMHRIVASFLRSVSHDPKQEFMALARWLKDLLTGNRPWSEVKDLVRHARIAAQRFSGWLSAAGDSEGGQIAAGLGMAMATARLEDDAARGLRFTGAEFCDAIGAGDRLATELDQLFTGGDHGTRKAVVGVASGLHRSEQAALLLTRAFSDPEPAVRWLSYTQAGFSDRAELLVIPLLDALMQEPSGEGLRNVPLHLGEFLKADPPVLRSLLSQIAHHLTEADAEHRVALVKILGQLLRRHQGNLQAGGWNSQSVAGGLLSLARNDPNETVRHSAAAAAGQWENEASYQALIEALASAGDCTSWKKAGFALAHYCAAIESPPPPSAEMREIDGELQVVISLTPGVPRRTELYAPLAKAALTATEPELRSAAVEVVTSKDSGKLALSDAVLELIDAGRPNEALPAAEETIRQLPGFSSGYWWRGRALDALERNNEAMADYTRVIQLSPQFAEAYYRRGIIRALSGNREQALEDFDATINLEKDHGNARFYQAIILHQLGRNLEAVQTLDVALMKSPQDARLHHLRAGCLAQLGRNQEAIAATTAALAINNAVAETWLIRANAHLNLEQFDQSLQDLEKAASLDAADARIEVMRQWVVGRMHP